MTFTDSLLRVAGLNERATPIATLIYYVQHYFTTAHLFGHYYIIYFSMSNMHDRKIATFS